MKRYPKSIEDCIKELKEMACNMEFCKYESLLTWSSAYLKDYAKENGRSIDDNFLYGSLYESSSK